MSEKTHLEFKIKILEDHRRQLVEQLNYTILEISETRNKLLEETIEIPDREPNDLEDK